MKIKHKTDNGMFYRFYILFVFNVFIVYFFKKYLILISILFIIYIFPCVLSHIIYI